MSFGKFVFSDAKFSFLIWIFLEIERIRLFKKAEISLWVYTYDDFFSDFNLWSYPKRSLSVDFLDEARRAFREKATEGIELNILVLKRSRNFYVESLIKKDWGGVLRIILS